MAAPYNYILSKAEAALVAWLGTQNLGTANVWQGRRLGKKVGQNVVIYAESATETPAASGNYKVLIRVAVRSPLGADDETVALHDTLCGKTFDALKLALVGDPDYFATAVNAIFNKDFTMLGNFNDMPFTIAAGHDGDFWSDSLSFTIYAAPGIIG